MATNRDNDRMSDRTSSRDQDNLSEAARKMRSSDPQERSEGAHELGQVGGRIGGHIGGQASARSGAASASGIAHALKGVDFPANVDDLVQHARRNSDVSDQIIEAIRDLPGREFQSMADVEEALHEEKSGSRSQRGERGESWDRERESARGSGSYSSGSRDREEERGSSRRSSSDKK